MWNWLKDGYAKLFNRGPAGPGFSQIWSIWDNKKKAWVGQGTIHVCYTTYESAQVAEERYKKKGLDYSVKLFNK